MDEKKLIALVLSQDVPTLKKGLKKGGPLRALVKLADEAGFTALHHACVVGSCDAARLLLDGGADVNALTAAKETPLHIAAREGNVAMAKVLVKCGASPLPTLENGWAALNFACDSSSSEMAEVLLRAGANPNIRTASGTFPLAQSIEKGGSDDLIRLLLDKGAVADMCKPDGMSALMLAASMGNVSLTRLMIRGGANVHLSVRDTGATALRLAIDASAPSEVIDLLLKAGATDACNLDGTSPLMAAISNGREADALKMLEKGFSANAKSVTGWMPLHLACDRASFNVVQVLLDKGADPNIPAPDGTVVLLALLQRRSKASLDCINHGADLNAKSPTDGQTALHVACTNDMPVIVELLLKKGASVHAKNAAGQSVADSTMSKRCRELIAKQLKKEEKATLKGKKGSKRDVPPEKEAMPAACEVCGGSACKKDVCTECREMTCVTVGKMVMLASQGETETRLVCPKCLASLREKVSRTSTTSMVPDKVVAEKQAPVPVLEKAPEKASRLRWVGGTMRALAAEAANLSGEPEAAASPVSPVARVSAASSPASVSSPAVVSPAASLSPSPPPGHSPARASSASPRQSGSFCQNCGKVCTTPFCGECGHLNDHGAAKAVAPLCVVLLGRTGQGRSTLGNVLLNLLEEDNAYFPVGHDVLSCTSDTSQKQVSHGSAVYKVVDTVGFGNTTLSAPDVLFSIAHCLKLARPRVFQFLYVCSEKISAEELKAFDALTRILGEEALKWFTVVRCKFRRFQDSDMCARDVAEVSAQSDSCRKFVEGVRAVVHVDNCVGSSKAEESLEVLLEELAKCSSEDQFLVPEPNVLLARVKALLAE
jgi:ankyrin repeat protein